MPADHSRKAAIRKRMAATGESFHRAAKAVDHDRWVERATTPPCGVKGHVWGCELCPAPDPDTIDAWGSPRGGPAPEPYVCPGPNACEDLDCFNGCNDFFVRMCSDCSYTFGATADDPGDGSCPNGCRRWGLS